MLYILPLNFCVVDIVISSCVLLLLLHFHCKCVIFLHQGGDNAVGAQLEHWLRDPLS
jgi:hypothetical protein